MGLLRPYSQADTPEETPEEPAPKAASGKNRPTPTRKEAEAARLAAVHPKLTRKQVRAANAAADRKQQADRMEAVDNMPERVMMRNYVDSHWSLLEFMMVLLGVLVVAMMVGTSPKYSFLLGGVTVLLYFYMIAGFLNFMIVWFKFKRELIARHPNARTKGLAFAMLSRMMSIRRMRQPAPTIKRGDPY